MAAVITLPAPAKLTLRLRVVGRRDDGMHLLEGDGALLDFYDTVTIRARADGRIIRRWHHPQVSAAEDLCARAAKRLREFAGLSAAGADIAVQKRLPVGGGLGGGSSNAAATLLGLNILWKVNMPRAELMNVAADLGADVPFFIGGESAAFDGIGAPCGKIQTPLHNYLLVFPPVTARSADVYAAYDDLTSAANAGKIPPALQKSDNDLTLAAARLYPAIADAAEALCAAGAEARLSGSGAAVFAEFIAKESAYMAQTRLPADLPSVVAHGIKSAAKIRV